MSNAEQVLRLLRELERVDRELDEDDEDDSPRSEAGLTATLLLDSLIKNDFDVSAAILGVHGGA